MAIADVIVVRVAVAAAFETVVSGAPGQRIVPFAGPDDVITLVAEEVLVRVAADQHVVGVAAFPHQVEDLASTQNRAVSELVSVDPVPGNAVLRLDGQRIA